MASTDSPLLKLAGELRNKIYRYALTDETMDVNRDNIRKHMGLLQTCRQVRKEAIGIFYAENRFMARIKLEDYTALSQWLKMIGPHANTIVRLYVLPRWRDPALLEKLEDLATHLRAATIPGQRAKYATLLRLEWETFFRSWQKVLIEVAKSMYLAGVKVEALSKPRG